MTASKQQIHSPGTWRDLGWPHFRCDQAQPVTPDCHICLFCLVLLFFRNFQQQSCCYSSVNWEQKVSPWWLSCLPQCCCCHFSLSFFVLINSLYRWWNEVFIQKDPAEKPELSNAYTGFQNWWGWDPSWAGTGVFIFKLAMGSRNEPCQGSRSIWNMLLTIWFSFR